MTAWVITLFDGRSATVEADEITTRNDGSLWLLRTVAPPPDKLTPTAVLARDLWASAHPADAEIDSQQPPSPTVDWRQKFA